MSGSAGLDLPKLLALVKARARLLVAITLLAAGIAFAVSLVQADRFRATAVLLFGGTPRAEVLVAGGSSSSNSDPQQETSTNVAIASLDSVVARVKQRLGTPATLEALKSAVRIEAVGTSNLVKLTATWKTADGAARLATTFGEEVVALRREMAQAEIQRAIDALNQTIATGDAAQAGQQETPAEIATLKQRVAQLVALKAVQTGDVRLAERATPAQSPSSPRPVFNAIAAGLVALAIALGVVVLLAGLDKRVHDERELAELIPAPVLSRIPTMASRSRRFLANGAREEDTAFLESIQFLRLNVQRFRPQGHGVVVAVTSPMTGDGKTMVVAWLAQALAFNDAEAEVLAVDCDLRHPMLHTYFDDREELGGALPNLRMVNASDYAVLPGGLTGQEPLRAMFDELRDQADYVVVDTSPVASVAHASAVAAAADGVILVVDLARIRRPQLLAANEQLANARATPIGIVLNRAAADVVVYHADEERASR